LFIPPKAIKLFLKLRDRVLNFIVPRKLLFFLLLKIGDKNISSHCWANLVLISKILWADPIILKFFFNAKFLKLSFLLNAGI